MDRPQRRTDAEGDHADAAAVRACGSVRSLFARRFARRLCVSVACLSLALAAHAEDKPAEPKPAASTPAAEPAAKPSDTPAATPTVPGTTHVDTKPADVPKPPTDEQIAQIVWEEFSADNTWVCPFAQDFSRNDEFPERKTDWEDFLAKFAVWAPGHVFDNTEKVRNLVSACALMDIGQGQFESELPLFVYQRLRREVPDEKLKAILAYMAFHPNEGSVIGTAPELNLDIGVGEDQIRERLQIFAVKMLGRMLGKLPWEPPAQP